MTPRVLAVSITLAALEASAAFAGPGVILAPTRIAPSAPPLAAGAAFTGAMTAPSLSISAALAPALAAPSAGLNLVAAPAVMAAAPAAALAAPALTPAAAPSAPRREEALSAMTAAVAPQLEALAKPGASAEGSAGAASNAALILQGGAARDGSEAVSAGAPAVGRSALAASLPELPRRIPAEAPARPAVRAAGVPSWIDADSLVAAAEDNRPAKQASGVDFLKLKDKDGNTITLSVFDVTGNAEDAKSWPNGFAQVRFDEPSHWYSGWIGTTHTEGGEGEEADITAQNAPALYDVVVKAAQRARASGKSPATTDEMLDQLERLSGRAVAARPTASFFASADRSDAKSMLQRAFFVLADSHNGVRLESADVQIVDGKAGVWRATFWGRPRGLLSRVTPYTRLSVTIGPDGMRVTEGEKRWRPGAQTINSRDVGNTYYIGVEQAIAKTAAYYPDFKIESVSLTPRRVSWHEPAMMPMDPGSDYSKIVPTYSIIGRSIADAKVAIVQELAADSAQGAVDLGAARISGAEPATAGSAWVTLTLFADMSDFTAASAKRPLRAILDARRQALIGRYGVEWISPEIDTMNIPNQSGGDVGRYFTYRIKLPAAQYERLKEDGFRRDKAMTKLGYVAP